MHVPVVFLQAWDLVGHSRFLDFSVRKDIDRVGLGEIDFILKCM